MTDRPPVSASAAKLLPLLCALPEEVRRTLLALLTAEAPAQRQRHTPHHVPTVEVPDPDAVAELVARLRTLERRVRVLEDRHKPGLVTIKQAAQRIPALTEDAIRAHIKRREKNGLLASKALIKKGTRWLIDLERLNRWLGKGRL